MSFLGYEKIQCNHCPVLGTFMIQLCPSKCSFSYGYAAEAIVSTSRVYGNLVFYALIMLGPVWMAHFMGNIELGFNKRNPSFLSHIWGHVGYTIIVPTIGWYVTWSKVNWHIHCECLQIDSLFSYLPIRLFVYISSHRRDSII